MLVSLFLCFLKVSRQIFLDTLVDRQTNKYITRGVMFFMFFLCFYVLFMCFFLRPETNKRNQKLVNKNRRIVTKQASKRAKPPPTQKNPSARDESSQRAYRDDVDRPRRLPPPPATTASVPPW